MLLGALVVLLLLAGLSMAGAERRLDRRDDQLASTRQTLKETRDLLGAVRGELADRVKERDGLKADLDKAKGSLSDAQHSVESQSAQLKTLKDCLNAIEDVGVALDRGDDAGARAALDRADRSCSQAEAYL